MDRYRMLPSYRFYDVEGTSPLTLDRSVGKPLRDYKIYGNSVQDGTPSPDNPIEIQSCGDKSKNLLDISSLVHYDNSSNVRTTKTDNNLVVHSSESQTYVYIPSDKSKKGLFDRLKPSTTYRLKYSSRYLEGEPTPSQSRIIFVNSSSVAKLTFYIQKPTTIGQIVTLSTTFKTPADMSEYAQILIYGAFGNGSRTEIIDWIVTEETETVEPYEPYGYKIPIEVSGKNLFDIDDVISYEGINVNCNISKNNGLFTLRRTAVSGNMGIAFTYPLKAGKYSVKIDYLSTNYNPNSAYIMYFSDKSICHDYSSVGYPNTVKYLNVTKDMTLSIILYTNDGDKVVGNECTFSIMLSEGYSDIPYEPYKEPIVTNIYLDEPLYKISDYADYIDFKNGKVVRQVGVTQLDESITYYIYKYDSANFYGFYYYENSMIWGDHADGFCTYLKNSYSTIWFGVNTPVIYMSLPNIYNSKETDEERIQAFKDWLATLETPFLLYYILANPTEQSIDLPKLKTHKGTNIISVGTEIPPSNMQIQYYK